ncbi:hypothetical protein UT300018_22560 [Clostridium faecium]
MIIVSRETLPCKVLEKPNQYLVSTDIALANIGYPKEVWIVTKNLATLVVRDSESNYVIIIKLMYIKIVYYYVKKLSIIIHC